MKPESVFSRSKDDEIENCIFYHVVGYMKPTKISSFTSRFLFIIIKFLRLITDILHGIESKYKICCITAYITNNKWVKSGAGHILCYKCFSKSIIEECKSNKKK